MLILVSVLSVVAGSLLLSATSRYHTTFQSASWQESIVGAEAGVDVAMNELRKRVVQGAGTAFATNWTTKTSSGAAFANYGHAFPTGAQPWTLATHGGEGNQTLQTRVFVDVPGSGTTPTTDFAIPPDSTNSTFISQLDNPALRDPDGVDRSRWWFRIRALGVAGLAGSTTANLEKLDNRLRRFSFFHDWRTGLAVTSPQVARLVEVTAKPLTNFRNALMADKQINLNDQDVLIDSYDSSKGQYNATTNCGTMGNLATNGQLINAAHATVNGDAMTNNGQVNAGDNVTGQQSASFYQELTPLTNGMLNPVWAVAPDLGTITSSASVAASTDSTHPTLVRMDGVNLADDGSTINITVPPGAKPGTPSFIKVLIQGDLITNGSATINIDADVTAVVYISGNVSLQGNGIFNNSMLASHLVINGLQPTPYADGSTPPRSIGISTYQDFEGIIYAPNHDLNLALQAAPPSPPTTSPGSGGVAAPTLSPIGGNDGPGRGNSIDKQIQRVQNQLSNAQNTYNQDNAVYQKDLNAYQSGNLLLLPKLTSDQTTITADQQNINRLQSQLNALQGTAAPSSLDDHSRGYNGIYGGFVARTITVASKTHIHYDETLRQSGPVNHYQIVSWFEDNVSRDAVGGTEQFWWPVAAAQ